MQKAKKQKMCNVVQNSQIDFKYIIKVVNLSHKLGNLRHKT